MARRYSRRRNDGVVEYSDSLDELQASAVREHAQALRGTFGLIGLVLGALATYVLLRLYASEWPKAIRFILLLAGACSSAVIFARLAIALRALVAIAISVGVLVGIGYFIWKVL